MSKFATIFGLIVIITIGILKSSRADELSDAKKNLETLFAAFIDVIGGENTDYVKGLLTAFSKNRTIKDMPSLSSAALNTFNQYQYYFQNASYYSSQQDKPRQLKLMSALCTYETSFSSGQTIPISDAVTKLKGELGSLPANAHLSSGIPSQ